MNCYRVTFGVTTQDVYAEDEKTAWAKFAEKNDLARVQPKAFDRTIELLPPPSLLDESSEPVASKKKKK